MEKQETSRTQRLKSNLKNSLTFKILSIGLLVLILMIPKTIIQELIYERESFRRGAVQEVSQSWGTHQTITGPVLTIPYSSWSLNDKKEKIEYRNKAFFLPEELEITGTLEDQIKRRGIFEIILYKSDLKISGFFEKPDFSKLHIADKDVYWEEAKISIGITGMQGIKNAMTLNWNNKKLNMEPGTGATNMLKSGVSTEVDFGAGKEKYAFSVPIKLNGSELIQFEPVGKVTKVNLSSKWKSPSFFGNFLPEPDRTTVSDDGFNASWQILDLNRSYPQQWKKDIHRFGQSVFGVRLIQPIDEYAKNTRSAKYALLVIGLTFLIYFFFETLKKVDIHPFQYLLIGLALSIFYLLLLSLSEQIGFNYAYLVASIATVGLITIYSSGFLKNNALSIQLGLLLSVIYGFIYVVLQSEDFALLAGTIGIFIALAAVMFYSRKVNWYALGE